MSERKLSNRGNSISLPRITGLNLSLNTISHDSYLGDTETKDTSYLQNSTKKERSPWENKFKLLDLRQEVKNPRSSLQGSKQILRNLSVCSPNLKEFNILRNRKDMQKHRQSLAPMFFTSASQREEENKRNAKNIEEKFESELMNNVNQSFELLPEDSKKVSLVSETTPNQYYRHFKKLDKIRQQNSYFKLPNSSFTSILNASEILAVTPCKIGLIKEKGNEEDLIIKNMKYGDSYAKVLSEGIQQAPNVQNFYIGGNRITNKGADQLLQQISMKARVLELSDNLIGFIGCSHISRALKDSENRIEILNLESNKLGDSATSLILASLENNKTLSIFNLSNNFLSDRSAEKLAKLLESNYSLKELYLHWNSIKSTGGSLLFSALAENDRLKVFDISCNSIGTGGNSIDSICNFLIKNTEVVHLDLSNNYFNNQSSAKIAESLVSNRSIYGFHFYGNSGYVDSRGFLRVNDFSEDCTSNTHVVKRINGCKTLSLNIHRNLRDDDLRDSCWICDGWTEETITWQSEKSGEGSSDPLFIHFNFEGYQANYHGKQQSTDFPYKRMLPPGHLLYLYSCDEIQTYDQSDQERITKNPEGSILSGIQLFDGRKVDADIPNINFVNLKKNSEVFGEYYNPQITILPRTPDPIYVPEKKKKQKIKWTFPISIFAKWRPDDDELIKKCFEADWESCKIPQKIKKQEDQDQVKEFLRLKYRHIKETYKHFASLSPIQDIWCIQNGPWLEFISLINILDSKVKDADINLKWTATISGSEKGNPRNPERGINRHQLMEALVRIAEEKYILKYGKATTFFEAIKMMWDEHLEPVFVEKFNQQKWRSEVYWVEEVDLCLKAYKKIIEHIYKKFAKQKVKPGQAPFMCLDELSRIIQNAGLTEDEHFGTGVCYQAYNFAMMTQIDELTSDRIFQMSILEFYEALARIANEASLPVGPNIVPADFEWTWERRYEQKLAHKLEGLIIKLLNTVCDQSFKAQYPKIENSCFVKSNDSDSD